MDDVNGDEEDIGAKLTAAMEDEKSAAALRELRRTDSADNTPAGANEDDMIMCTVKVPSTLHHTIPHYTAGHRTALPPATDHRPPTAHYRPPTTGRPPPTTDHPPQGGQGVR